MNGQNHFVDLLRSQCRTGSQVLQSNKRHWVGAVGQPLAQLLRAEPMASPEIPLIIYDEDNTDIQLASHLCLYIPLEANTEIPPLPRRFSETVTTLPALPLAHTTSNSMIWARNLVPVHFPSHEDSVHAEVFHRLIALHRGSLPASISLHPFDMLQMLRQHSLLLHATDAVEMPTKFSYAHVVHGTAIPDSLISPTPNIPTLIITRFGVSAPRLSHIGRGLRIPNGLATVIRDYRVRRAWGNHGVDPSADVPPPSTTYWRHGHCAEMQAIPAVVERCEDLGLENVVIYSLTVNKSGTQSAAMCSNCRAYISTRVLKRHPSWKVVDVHSGKLCH